MGITYRCPQLVDKPVEDNYERVQCGRTYFPTLDGVEMCGHCEKAMNVPPNPQLEADPIDGLDVTDYAMERIETPPEYWRWQEDRAHASELWAEYMQEQYELERAGVYE